jgi:hypothetical protein
MLPWEAAFVEQLVVALVVFSAASDLAGTDRGQSFHRGGSHSATATGSAGSLSRVIGAPLTGEYTLDCRYGIGIVVKCLKSIVFILQ